MLGRKKMNSNVLTVYVGDVLSTKEIETYVRQLIHPKLEQIRNRAVEVFEDRITEILPDVSINKNINIWDVVGKKRKFVRFLE